MVVDVKSENRLPPLPCFFLCGKVPGDKSVFTKKQEMQAALTFLSCRLEKNVARVDDRLTPCLLAGLPRECLQTIVEYAANEVFRVPVPEHAYTKEGVDGLYGEQLSYYRYGRLYAIEELVNDMSSTVTSSMQTVNGKWSVSHGNGTSFLSTCKPNRMLRCVVFFSGGGEDVLMARESKASTQTRWVRTLETGTWNSPMPKPNGHNGPLLYVLRMMERFYAKHPHKSALLYVIHRIWKQVDVFL